MSARPASKEKPPSKTTSQQHPNQPKTTKPNKQTPKNNLRKTRNPKPTTNALTPNNLPAASPGAFVPRTSTSLGAHVFALATSSANARKLRPSVKKCQKKQQDQRKRTSSLFFFGAKTWQNMAKLLMLHDGSLQLNV